jgi:hypothetical protein
MLPILRIFPVGGVLLAIMILVLALNPPGAVRSTTPGPTAARGALMSLVEHPEWRQFLILAATRRADELARLSELPGMPARSNTADLEKFAGLPLARADADPDDETGSIADVPVMPMEIGETSSTELPVSAREEQPPVIKTPERARAPRDNRSQIRRHVRHAKLKGKPEAAPLNLLEAIFGKPPGKTQDAGKQSSQPAPVLNQN